MSKQTDLINIPDAITVSGSNVGIGTSSPAVALEIIGTTTSGIKIKTNSAHSNGFNLYWDSSADNVVFNNPFSGAMLFETANTEHMRLESGGNLLLRSTDAAGITGHSSPYLEFRAGQTNGQNVTLGKIKGSSPGGWGGDIIFETKAANGQVNDTTVERLRIRESGGITFNGDTANANTLDDYEEGSCTLTLRGSTGAPNTAQTTTGKYTKVGNTVIVTAIFANRDVTGATGLVQVTGLPFTSISEIHLGQFLNSRGDANQHAAYLPANSTNLYQSNKTGSSLSWGSTGVGVYAFFTITYMTN